MLGSARAVADASALDAAASTATVLLLGIAATLSWTQFMRATRLRDLLQAGGLGILSVTLLAALVGPLLLGPAAADHLLAVPVLGVLPAGALLLWASLIPGHRVAALRSWIDYLAALICVLAALIFIAEAVPFGFHLSAAQGHPGFGSYPVADTTAAVILLACAALVVIVAAVATVIRRDRQAGGAPLWGVGGLVLLAIAEVIQAVPVSSMSGLARESLAARLLAAGLMFAGAVTRERQLQSGIARRSALAERQRIARDLHDGMAQDLAFIAAHGARLGELGDAMALAARRALAVSRGVISDLSDLSGYPAPEALAAIAQELGDRFGVSITVEIDQDLELPANVSDDLQRIVRESIVNAARHGAAANVSVSVQSGIGGSVLRVRDDGRGIADADGITAPEGFGIASMRARAAMLGGQLTVRQAESGGTELVVAWR